MRFLRRAATEGMRRYLDVRQNMPTDAEDRVLGVYELRPVHYWEEFDADIVRWWFRTTVAAIAGQTSSLQFNPEGQLPAPAWPRETLVLVDEVRNEGTTSVIVQIGAGPQTAPGFVFPSVRDARWAEGTAAVNLPVGSGQAGVSGGNVAVLNANAGGLVETYHARWSSRVRGPALGGVGTFELRGTALNQAVTVAVNGRIVIAR